MSVWRTDAERANSRLTSACGAMAGAAWHRPWRCVGGVA